MSKAPPIEKQPKEVKLCCATCGYGGKYCNLRVTEWLGRSKITPLHLKVEPDWYCDWWISPDHHRVIHYMSHASGHLRDGLEKVPSMDCPDDFAEGE